MNLELKNAKQIALNAQLYSLQSLSGKQGVQQLIRRLGYVQLDTISVVERAHHHTIWSRINEYNKCWLEELLASDRQIFEHWGHAASYLPIEDYRFSLPRMRKFPDNSSWERQFFEKYKHLRDNVIKRIKEEGPLSAKDFPDERKTKTNPGWGTGKPEKIALELLLWKGELMVDRRDKFQRVYDLTERILPSWVDKSYPKPEELYKHYILRSLAALGIATQSDIRGHFMLKQSAEFTLQFNNLIESGELVSLSVEGLPEVYYALPEGLNGLPQLITPTPSVSILSPFDNVVIQRPRLKKLFGFDYTIECYIPPAKRIYGYWCLPLLYGQQFVGRLDCKANRKAKQMELIKLHWEVDVKPDKCMKQALQEAFDRFAKFCGCESVKVNLPH